MKLFLYVSLLSIAVLILPSDLSASEQELNLVTEKAIYLPGINGHSDRQTPVACFSKRCGSVPRS